MPGFRVCRGARIRHGAGQGKERPSRARRCASTAASTVAAPISSEAFPNRHAAATPPLTGRDFPERVQTFQTRRSASGGAADQAAVIEAPIVSMPHSGGVIPTIGGALIACENAQVDAPQSWGRLCGKSARRRVVSLTAAPSRATKSQHVQARFHGRGGDDVVTAAELLLCRVGGPHAPASDLGCRAHRGAGRGVLQDRRQADPPAAADHRANAVVSSIRRCSIWLDLSAGLGAGPVLLPHQRRAQLRQARLRGLREALRRGPSARRSRNRDRAGSLVGRPLPRTPSCSVRSPRSPVSSTLIQSPRR